MLDINKLEGDLRSKVCARTGVIQLNFFAWTLQFNSFRTKTNVHIKECTQENFNCGNEA